jgi:hypothetical protein
MVNRREFLVAAVATSGVSKLAESKQATDGEARREGPISYSALPTYLPPGCVKVGGELGRRIDMTINKNVLILDADQDFLKPLQERTRKSGYIGLGKLIDASARLARYTGDERVLTLKRHIVAENPGERRLHWLSPAGKPCVGLMGHLRDGLYRLWPHHGPSLVW